RTTQGMLDGIKKVTQRTSTFTWVDAAFLAAHKVSPWSDIPVWIPPPGEEAAFSKININKSVSKGLTFRSVPDTTQATLDWFKKQSAERQAKLRAGITAQRETEVLAAWHASKK